MGSSCYGRAHEKYKVKLKDRGLTRISTTSIHLQNTVIVSDIQKVGDLSEMLSVSQRTIERDLSAMQKNGILKHEGKDNDGMWVVLST